MALNETITDFYLRMKRLRTIPFRMKRLQKIEGVGVSPTLEKSRDKCHVKPHRLCSREPLLKIIRFRKELALYVTRRNRKGETRLGQGIWVEPEFAFSNRLCLDGSI